MYVAQGPGGAIPDDAVFHELVSKTVPPGLYAVIATVQIGQQFSNGDEMFAKCELRNVAFSSTALAKLYDAHFGDECEYTMLASVWLPSGGSLKVLCMEDHDAPGIRRLSQIMAMRVAPAN